MYEGFTKEFKYEVHRPFKEKSSISGDFSFEV